METHLLDLADRDLEAFVVGPQSPHLAVLVVGTDVMTVTCERDGACESGRTTESGGNTLVTIDMAVFQESRPVQTANDAIGTADTEIVLVAVIPVVVDAVPIVDVPGSQSLRERRRVLLLDPFEEGADGVGHRPLLSHDCRSNHREKRGRDSHQKILPLHDELLWAGMPVGGQ